MELPHLAKAQSATQLRKNKVGISQVEINRRQIESIPKLDALNELNQCALFNQRSDHRQALQHADQAVLLLQQDVLNLRTKMESANADPNGQIQEKNIFLEKTSLLSIAYYNKGCECEHLHKLLNATQAFTRAVNLQSGRHGNQVLLGQFKLSLKQAKFKLRQQMIPGPSNKPVIKSGSETRLRPVSANFHFSAQGTDQKPSYSTYYNTQTPEMFVGRVPDRPQTAVQDQLQNIRPLSLNATSQHGALLPLSSCGTNDRNEEMENQSFQQRKNIWSECDAHTDLHNFSVIHQPGLLQMQQRPPKNNIQRNRGTKQAIQRRHTQQNEKVKPIGHPQFHMPPQHQNPHFTVVDEAVESMEKNPSPQNNKEKIRGFSKQFSSPLLQDPSWKTTNSKKLLERGGRMSLGSQTLFKAFISPQNQISTVKKPTRKINSGKVVLIPQQSSTNNELMKIITHTEAYSKPVLSKTKFKSTPDVGRQQKTVHKLQQEVMNLTEQSQNQILEEPSRFKGIQEHTKRTELSSKVPQAFECAIEQQQAENLVSIEFMEYFESKKDDPVFDNAIRMIFRLVTRMRYRKLTYDLLQKSKESKEKLAGMLRRRNGRKQIKSALEANRKEKEASKPFKDEFESKKDNPVFQKSIKMILGLVKRRRWRNSSKLLMAQVKSDKIAATYRILYNVIKLQRIYRRNLALRKALKESEQKVDVQKSEQAAFMIQSLFRRRRFRKLISNVQKNNTIEQEQEKVQTIDQKQAQLRKGKMQRIMSASLEVDKEVAPEANELTTAMSSTLKRRLFRKLSWNDMYLKRIEEHPQRLEHIIRVQSQFRRQKAKRIVYAMLTKNRLKDPKYKKAAQMIQTLWRRRKFRIAAYALLTKKRQEDPKYQHAATMIQSLFKRRKARKVVHQVLWQIRAENPKFIKAVNMMQRSYRRFRFRKAVNQMIMKRKAQMGIQLVACVSKIQLLFRRVRAVRQINRLRVQKLIEGNFSLMWTFVRIQRRFRRNRLERIAKFNVMREDPVYDNAVRMIQSLFKRKMMRKLFTGALSDQRKKEKQAGQKLKNMLRQRKTKTIVHQKAQNKVKFLKQAPEPLAKTLEPISLGLEGEKRVIQQEIKNNLQDIISKQKVSAASRIQKWFRRLRIQIKTRNAFLSARPFLVKTFEQQGIYFKCSVQQFELESLLFTIKRLPSMRSSQELVIKLPEERVMFFSNHEFALQQIQLIDINQDGKASILETTIRPSLLNMPTFGFGLSSPDQLIESPQQVFQKSVESLLLTDTQQEPIDSHRMVNVFESPIIPSSPSIVEIEVPIIKTTISTVSSKVSRVASVGRLQSRPPSVTSSFKSQAIQTPKKPTSALSSASRNSVKKDVMTATFSHTAKNSFFPSTLPVINNKEEQARPNFSDNGSQHFSVPRSLRYDDAKSMTSNQSVSYKITIEPKGQPIEIKVCFQPAIVKRKNFLMVTLLKRLVPLDRKILPIDIYTGAMAVGLYDLDHFCQEWVMPCLQIKEIKGKKHCLVVNEKRFTELRQRCEIETLQIQQKPSPKQKSTSPRQKQTSPKQTISSNGSKRIQNTVIIPKPKQVQNKNRGVLPLIKRIQTLDYKEYQFEAVFDFDLNTIRFTAERPGENLSLDLQLESETIEEAADLYQRAEDFVNQLTVSKRGLELKQANKSVIREENTFYRDGKQLNGRFYLISVGFQNAQLVIDAYDKSKENRLVLRLDWNSRTRVLSNQEAQKLVDKLDVMELAGQLMLIVK